MEAMNMDKRITVATCGEGEGDGDDRLTTRGQKGVLRSRSLIRSSSTLHG